MSENTSPGAVNDLRRSLFARRGSGRMCRTARAAHSPTGRIFLVVRRRTFAAVPRSLVPCSHSSTESSDLDNAGESDRRSSFGIQLLAHTHRTHPMQNPAHLNFDLT